MILNIIVRPGLTRYLDVSKIQSKLSEGCEVQKNPNTSKTKRDFHESVELTLVFKKEVTLEQLLNEINIPKDECGIVIFNNKKIELEDCINEDGHIKIYPPIIGG